MSKLTIGPAIRDNREGLQIGRFFHWVDRSPSWKMFDKGSAQLKILGHRTSGIVHMTTSETTEKGTTKITMLELDRTAAVALRDTLNTILGGSSREERTLLGYPAIGTVSDKQS